MVVDLNEEAVLVVRRTAVRHTVLTLLHWPLPSSMRAISCQCRYDSAVTSVLRHLLPCCSGSGIRALDSVVGSSCCCLAGIGSNYCSFIIASRCKRLCRCGMVL